MTTAGQILSRAAQAVVVSGVRTTVPLLVGWLVSLATVAGMDIDKETVGGAAAAAVPLVAGYIWYVLGRLLERWKPKLGWLLGFASKPVYGGGAGLALSLWRTAVPYFVGWLVVAFGWLHIPVDNDTVEQLVVGALSVLVAVAYYLTARILEAIRSSKFGWLLLAPVKPTYAPAVAVAAPAPVQPVPPADGGA